MEHKPNTRPKCKAQQQIIRSSDIEDMLISSDDSDSDPNFEVSFSETSDMSSSAESDISDTVSNRVCVETDTKNTGSDDDSDWGSVTGVNQKIFTFCGKPSPHISMPRNPSPSNVFRMLIDDEVVDLIARETNANAVRKLGRKADRWVKASHDDIYKFLGIVAYMGLVKLPKISDYWSQKELYKNRVVPAVMSRNRFQSLLRYFHVSDEGQCDPGDRLAKVRSIVELMQKKFTCLKVPGENVIIDESMIPFRGRLRFKQYIPGKRHKYGIKIYKLCDTEGYTYKMIVYAGKDVPVSIGTRVSDSVVFKLMESYTEEGRTLIVDNYYTNLQLAHQMLNKKTHLVGTLRKNVKGIPRIISSAKLSKGDIIGQENKEGVVVAMWRDRRDVRFLSTKHTLTMTDTGRKNRQGDLRLKPSAILFYNKHKQGIDLSDQMSSYFTPLRKTIRWYHKVVFEILLGTAMVNALLLYKTVSGQSMPVAEFREQVIITLLRFSGTSSPQTLSQKHCLQESTEKLSNNRKKRWKCSVCYEKLKKDYDRPTALKKCKLVSTFCKACPEKKYMCIPCFEEKHT